MAGDYQHNRVRALSMVRDRSRSVERLGDGRVPSARGRLAQPHMALRDCAPVVSPVPAPQRIHAAQELVVSLFDHAQV